MLREDAISFAGRIEPVGVTAPLSGGRIRQIKNTLHER
jgi:hypothetical protein